MTDVASPLERLAACDVATVHEAAGRIGNLSGQIRPIQQGVTVAGTAVTAGVQPGDNLAVHLAILELTPGSILVIAAGGHLAGYWGEVLAVAAYERGAIGMVIDGGCRDTAALRRRGFPVWSAGVSVHGCVKEAPGTVNKPVAVGGVVVSPGDYILADDDGVVAIPPDRIDDVLAATEARFAKEERIFTALANGETTIDLMGLGEAAARA